MKSNETSGFDDGIRPTDIKRQVLRTTIFYCWNSVPSRFGTSRKPQAALDEAVLNVTVPNVTV